MGSLALMVAEYIGITLVESNLEEDAKCFQYTQTLWCNTFIYETFQNNL